MEGKSSSGDTEINKEKLLVVKDELRRLCYEMKKKEINRNSTHSKMQQYIRQQWETIADLKKQKSELILQLRLQESESFSNKANQNLENFMKSLSEVIRLENQLKEQNDQLDRYKHEILELDKKLRQKQKEVVKAQRSKGRVLKYQKNISFLENRLNGSLHKYNQLLVSNKAVRDDINSLLLTQSSFRRKYSNIKHLLALGKKTLSEVVHSATVSYQTGESVKYKLNLVKERTQVDQKKLGEKIKELKILVEQDKQLKEFLDFKMKDRTASSESEEISKNEQIMEQRLQACHGILSRIQMASGCKDVNRICKVYMQGEETNLDLFEKVNGMSLEIEKLHEEVRAQRQELEIITRQYKEQKRKDLAVKHDLENATDKLRTEAQNLEDATDAKVEELESVKEVLQRIYTFLDKVSCQQVSFTVDEGITDDNILQYLEALERRIIDLIHCYRLADIKNYGAHKIISQISNCSHRSCQCTKRIASNYNSEPKSNLNSYPKVEAKTYEVPYNKDHLEVFAKNSKQRLQFIPELL
ncbi:coiled-coil domain-containing protein 63 [Caerostris darwini]|uniref:Coiled-coil domain-containing protein 63 n=1 Tax=Caerostris darwini TaxID=1538125 RepID=A0AAV4UX48_9ARAC|nr:coiled-coil domain-containing protein 63 [Caerostris darwini]